MSTIQYLTQIEFGAGVLRLLPEALQALDVRRPLMIGDRGLLAAGLVDRICATLPAGMKLQRYLDTPANPTEAAVEAAAALYRDGDCDGIVAIGGGSPIDLAKGVALMATHPGPLSRYTGMAAMPLIGAQTAPIVAVPTTAGTGSEVGRGALLCLRDGRKLVVVSPYLLPRRAICDPELTLSLPPALTAGTGMDALTHCVETFLSPRFNPPADAIALDGAARAWRWIERAVAHPGDIQARTEMMIAGIHGGLAFQKGLGAVHALAHPLGALTEPLLHHGTVNAVLLPAVLRFNAAHVGDKFARLAATFGLPAAVDLPAAVSALCDRIGMPPSLRAMGVPADACDAVVAGALADHSLPTNPRPLDASALRTLFHEAMG
ncbi:MAG: 4-hydroxybutyrate dehydrogenase [Variovorax sp.]|nr:4-hydroxybutyrate dehydrogenase [Variovorax sp.]